MPETQSKPSAGARELALKIFVQEHGNPKLREGCETTYEDLLRRDQGHVDEAAALIDAALAPLRRCVWQYLEDTIGEQRDPEEIAKALGQYAPASSRELAEALAPWEPESGGGE